MNRLAVVIPVWNKIYWTQKTIESLIKCTKSELTIILVDDNSTDDTMSYSLELGHRLNENGTHFYYHKNEKNIGVNAAWNTGLRIAMATGIENICIANNDLLFTDGWDLPLIDALNNGYWLVSPYSTEMTLPNDWPNGGNRHTNPVSEAMKILGACFMFQPKLIEAIGYFPEEFRIYFGDNWIQDMTRVRELKTGHIRESYIHHFFCQTTSGLDNNKLFAEDGAAYNEYCKNFKLDPTT